MLNSIKKIWLYKSGYQFVKIIGFRKQFLCFLVYISSTTFQQLSTEIL